MLTTNLSTTTNDKKPKLLGNIKQTHLHAGSDPPVCNLGFGCIWKHSNFILWNYSRFTSFWSKWNSKISTVYQILWIIQSNALSNTDKGCQMLVSNSRWDPASLTPGHLPVGLLRGSLLRQPCRGQEFTDLHLLRTHGRWKGRNALQPGPPAGQIRIDGGCVFQNIRVLLCLFSKLATGACCTWRTVWEQRKADNKM